MRVGKLVRGARYVHRDVIDELDDAAQAAVTHASQLASDAVWNVVRIEAHAIGLLLYEKFDTAAFPRLLASTRVDLRTGGVSHRRYGASVNPLILHRKEELVGEHDPRRVRWAETTSRLEQMGLFRDGHLIGRAKVWTRRLADADLIAVGDEVISA